MKNILVQFDCRIGDYEHQSYYIFNKKKSEWGYCKEFWGINKRDSNCLKENMFWDNEMMNAIVADINSYDVENRFLPKYNVYSSSIYNTTNIKNTLY